MSWDAYIYTIVDGKEVEIHEGWNYTHNCNGMLRTAGFEEWPYDVKSMRGTTFAEKLSKTVEQMEKEPGEYRKMDPKNGWGSYDTLLPILKDMLEVARQYPSAFWEVHG